MDHLLIITIGNFAKLFNFYASYIFLELKVVYL